MDAEQYEKLRFNKSIFTRKNPDNCVFMNEKENLVVVIESFIKFDGQVYLLSRKYLQVEDMYDYPLSSKMLNEMLISNLSSILECFPVRDIICKAIRIPITIPENAYFFVSLL